MPKQYYSQHGGVDCRNSGKICHRPSGSGRCKAVDGKFDDHGCVCNPNTGNCVLLKNNPHLQSNILKSDKPSTKPIAKAKPKAKPDVYQHGFKTQVNQLVRNQNLFEDTSNKGIVPSYQDVGGGGDCQFLVLSNIVYGTPNSFGHIRQTVADMIRQNGPCYPRWYFEAEPLNTTLEQFCYNIEKNRNAKNSGRVPHPIIVFSQSVK